MNPSLLPKSTAIYYRPGRSMLEGIAWSLLICLACVLLYWYSVMQHLPPENSRFGLRCTLVFALLPLAPGLWWAGKYGRYSGWNGKPPYLLFDQDGAEIFGETRIPWKSVWLIDQITEPGAKGPGPTYLVLGMDDELYARRESIPRLRELTKNNGLVGQALLGKRGWMALKKESLLCIVIKAGVGLRLSLSADDIGNLAADYWTARGGVPRNDPGVHKAG